MRILPFGLIVFLAACSGTSASEPPFVASTETSSPTPGGDRPPAVPPNGDVPPAVDAGAEAGSPPVGPVTPTCNAIVQKGSAVTPVIANGPLPKPPMGGTVADGTYMLTSIVVHAPPSPTDPAPGPAMKVTIGIAGNVFQSVTEQHKNVFRHNGTFTYGGTTATMTFDCEHPTPILPSPPKTFEYSATATSIVTFEKVTKDTTTVTTYTKL